MKSTILFDALGTKHGVLPLHNFTTNEIELCVRGYVWKLNFETHTYLTRGTCPLSSFWDDELHILGELRLRCSPLDALLPGNN
ncbi:hypothetical protein GDO81_018115 [Engystomops pustulosus]|uniref:Uncharacterized protein n=1 Tax=Engystomops pustulosus TaxID=76066 RepID=A0AAV7AB86_ENGPU|nr:hypothetical protein GDO81_018115 [Engystomops pustulosus]